MAAVLPVFLIYVLVDKPDYKIMNGLAHVVLPVANYVGDVLSWPIRIVGNAATSIRELSNLRIENRELRIQLEDAMRDNNECVVAHTENQRLQQELDSVRSMPQKAIVANISYDNRAFHHNTFFINKGQQSGIDVGMAVVSFDGLLIGTVIDSSANFAKVRNLTDLKSNIPVRIAGSDVYGFLQGNNTESPTLGFLSNPEFKITPGMYLVTSNISGVLPDGIIIGETKEDMTVKVSSTKKMSRVMVLQFDGKDKYK